MTKEALRKIIGNNIREERISRSITVDELAELLELTPGFVGLIERGRRGATVYNLYKLSEIFGIDIDRMLLGSTKSVLKVSERNSEKVKRTKINSLIYQLGESELDFVIAIIKNLKNLKNDKATDSKLHEDAEVYSETPIDLFDDGSIDISEEEILGIKRAAGKVKEAEADGKRLNEIIQTSTKKQKTNSTSKKR